MLLSLCLISYEYYIYNSMFSPLWHFPFPSLCKDALRGSVKVRDGPRNIKCPSLNNTCKIWSFHVDVLLKREWQKQHHFQVRVSSHGDGCVWAMHPFFFSYSMETNYNFHIGHKNTISWLRWNCRIASTGEQQEPALQTLLLFDTSGCFSTFQTNICNQITLMTSN